MKILYIYGGSRDINIESSKGESIFSYCLNNGKILGNSVSNLNDANLLNSIATNMSLSYSNYIFSLNKEFLDNRIIHNKDLSLYFLSELSIKRSEIFSTYGNICNSILIKRLVSESNFDQIKIVDISESLHQCLMSILHHTSIKSLKIRRNKIFYTQLKFTLGSLLFFSKAVSLTCYKFLSKSEKNTFYHSRKIKDICLTRYPLHLDDELKEEKYGHFANNKMFLVHLLTDGFHQNISVRKMIKAFSFFKQNNRVLILDSFIKFSDIFKSFTIFFSLARVFFKLSRKKYYFDSIEISKNVQEELIFSYFRIPRILMWEESVKRFLNCHQIDNFFYYLHEYSLGRFFTYVFRKYSKETKLIGFQHGPSSKRKLLYMAGNNELTTTETSALKSFPVPDMVYAEDLLSKQIYDDAGYKDVKVMKEVYRLSYLKKIIRIKSEKLIYLIAPGLHDGEFMLRNLEMFIKKNNRIKFFLKPHPRANNNYLDKYKSFLNIEIYKNPIYQILPQVSKVFATYSSVATEARMIGIPVEIIELPGKINESPLIDREFEEHYINNR